MVCTERASSIPTSQLAILTESIAQRQINGALDLCFNCGGNHLVSSCIVAVDNPDAPTDEQEEEQEQEEEEYDEGMGDDAAGCQRCGRDSHDETHCYARTDVNGQSLE